jgi:hypothetical protein
MQIWNDLTPVEKTQVLWSLIMVLVATVLVLYAIAASRGHDVDYFKERLGLQEQRLNYMDQKIDKVAQGQHQQKEHVNEIRRMHEAHQRQLEDQQKWIEHWKSLPQLPKPPAKR